MNQIFDSTDERSDWSSALCDRSTNVLSVEYTVYIGFVRYTSVTHTAKSISRQFFVRLICATPAFYVLRARSTKTVIATFITG